MIVGYYIFQKSKDGGWIKNPAKQRNQLFDLKTAAIASYFDGLKTSEPALAAIYLVGRSLVRALGGYVRCGRG